MSRSEDSIEHPDDDVMSEAVTLAQATRLDGTMSLMTDPWPTLIGALARCRACHDEGLLEVGARPLFCEFRGVRSDLLFVLEAPNYDDTFDPKKGFVTIEAETDPSGKFFYELYTEVLEEAVEDLVVTNTILCLPARREGKHPVTSRLMRNCSANLRAQIESINPLIVVTVGKKALDAVGRIERHGQRKMATAVATPLPWFGRTLFPVYHTGHQARNGPKGRRADQQREDWRRLKTLLSTLRTRQRTASGHEI